MSMDKAKEVSLEKFDYLMRDRCGSDFPSAMTLFEEYGNPFSGEFTVALLFAHEAGKQQDFLQKVEEHHRDVLSLCEQNLRESPAFFEHPTYKETKAFLDSLMVGYRTRLAS